MNEKERSERIAIVKEELLRLQEEEDVERCLRAQHLASRTMAGMSFDDMCAFRNAVTDIITNRYDVESDE